MALALAAAPDTATAGQLAATPLPKSVTDKARVASQDFEAVYLNTMFQQMFAGLEGDGPLGGGSGPGGGVWRSFLTDEFAKSFVKAGGIGIADHVYRSLIAQQETQQK
jgi:flagellar protein FlgJ